MHVKDLIVTGDARILGKLYTDAELGGGGGGGETSGVYTLSKSGSTISLLRDGQSVSSVQDSDTISSYTHPTYTSRANGFYKVTVDGNGHVSGVTNVAKSDITALGIPGQDTVYSHPGTHPASMITGLAKVATSGSYNDLSNKPSIPAAYSHPGTHPASMITGLATVATSGSYNDLSNKPSIPAAANNGTLTIQRNGTTVTTFSANQSSNATANISVPTSINDIGGNCVVASASAPTNANAMIWIKTTS